MEGYKDLFVSEPTTYIDDKGFVDLGLSSGTLWCATNEWAQVPKEKGVYGNEGILEIGVVEPERYFKGRFFYNQIPGSRDLPTHNEFQELLDKCSWELGTLMGCLGYKITGPNGNSIFLPIEENSRETLYAGYTVGWAVDELEDEHGNVVLDNYRAVIEAMPDHLVIYLDDTDLLPLYRRDIFLGDFGAATFLLRTVIPQNRKIKRDVFENGEIPEFVPRSPKAAVQTQKRFIGLWDGE